MQCLSVVCPPWCDIGFDLGSLKVCGSDSVVVCHSADPSWCLSVVCPWCDIGCPTTEKAAVSRLLEPETDTC